MSGSDSINILIVDDDEDDRILAIQALQKSTFDSNVSYVTDGDELMDYLHRRGAFENDTAPMPDLILLDLNMPRKNGKEALRQIRDDKMLDHIPVVIFTTSQADQDIAECYKLGANSYIVKPVNFQSLVNVMNALQVYWSEFVQLPPNSAKELR